MQPAAQADGGIEMAIRAQLGTVGECGIRDLGILAIAGRIRLSGEALSYAEKTRAGRITAQVAGVRHVINQLRVMPS
jgi:osmotically-inducible protein OsmY